MPYLNLVVVMLVSVIGSSYGQSCTCSTPDVAPDETYSCAQQKSFGKCLESWMISGGFCCQACRLEVPDYCIADGDKDVSEYLNQALIGNVGGAAKKFVVLVKKDVQVAANALQRAVEIDIRTSARSTAEALAANPRKVAQVLSIVLGLGNPSLEKMFEGTLATAASRFEVKAVAQLLLELSDVGYKYWLQETIKIAADMQPDSAANSLALVVAEGVGKSTDIVEALVASLEEQKNDTLLATAETIAIVSDSSGANLGAYLVNKVLPSGGRVLQTFLAQAAEKENRCNKVGDALAKAQESTNNFKDLSTAISEMMVEAPCLVGCCGTIQPALVPVAAPVSQAIEPQQPESQDTFSAVPAGVTSTDAEKVDASEVLLDVSSNLIPCPRIRCSRFIGNCCNGVSVVLGNTCLGIANRQYTYTGVCKIGGKESLVVSPTRGGIDCYCSA
eukprot:TRINITY_DN7725_c1_g3_i1.p1 TRINITY_DN7725_c1_g3~~TRINITY_DN7725_c1_g3_i1.p1  ORF type:complete len:446 (-),score=46.66 TRINITY_DN7725_c1_g3_i1:566-1903(-)